MNKITFRHDRCKNNMFGICKFNLGVYRCITIFHVHFISKTSRRSRDKDSKRLIQALEELDTK